MGIAVSINKKRGGPSHRVRKADKGDGYPLVNDWFEAALVFTALCAVFGGVFAFYYVSQ
jgi:hypothetical protein